MSQEGCSGPLGRGELAPHSHLGRWIVYRRGLCGDPLEDSSVPRDRAWSPPPTCIPSSPSLDLILFGAKTLAEGTEGRGAYVSGFFGSLFLLSVD